jgi:hypothetical protein
MDREGEGLKEKDNVPGIFSCQINNNPIIWRMSGARLEAVSLHICVCEILAAKEYKKAEMSAS